MIELSSTSDYIYMLLVAAGVGAIGGLGAELILNRGGSTGILSLPHADRANGMVTLGFPASLIVGAIAAVAALYFFTPVVERVVTTAAGVPAQKVSEYNLAKLVPLALIVGSAGPAFLGSLQARLMSALNAQKAGAAAGAAKVQVDQIAASATAAVTDAVQTALSQHLPGTTADIAKEVAESAASSLQSTLEPQVEGAHRQVEAIAPTAVPPRT